MTQHTHKIGKIFQRLSRLRAENSGAAAVEFALILPLMVVTYIGVAEVSEVLSADRRAIAVARAASDVTAQYSTMDDATLTSIFATATPIMAPLSATNIKMSISTLVFNTNPGNPAGDPIPLVDWSASTGGGAKRPCSSITVVSNNTAPSISTIPRGVAAAGQTVVVADISYPYVPMFGQNIVPGGAISLKQTTYMRPRYVTRITYAGATATACNPNFTG